MGILKRFTDIMTSNINAMLDKAEDPAKMVDQYIRDLEEDLAKVKAETASVMADEARTKRELDACDQEIAKMQKYAEKAVLAGNDGDAKIFLNKKADLTANRPSLEQNYTVAAANAAKMRQMHDKLVKDIQSLNARRDAIKAKMQVAKTQERINKLGSSINGAADTMSAFDRMEAKANKMLDTANAMADLNSQAEDADADALAAKYDTPETEVDDELARLKASLGM